MTAEDSGGEGEERSSAGMPSSCFSGCECEVKGLGAQSVCGRG